MTREEKAIALMTKLLIENAKMCEHCKHKYKGCGEDCDYHISGMGVKGDDGMIYPYLGWSCMDWTGGRVSS